MNITTKTMRVILSTEWIVESVAKSTSQDGTFLTLGILRQRTQVGDLEVYCQFPIIAQPSSPYRLLAFLVSYLSEFQSLAMPVSLGEELVNLNHLERCYFTSGDSEVWSTIESVSSKRERLEEAELIGSPELSFPSLQAKLDSEMALNELFDGAPNISPAKLGLARPFEKL